MIRILRRIVDLCRYSSRAFHKGNANDHDLPDVFRRFHRINRAGAGAGSGPLAALASGNSAGAHMVSIRTFRTGAVRIGFLRAFSAVICQNYARSCAGVEGSGISSEGRNKSCKLAAALRIQSRPPLALDQTPPAERNNRPSWLSTQPGSVSLGTFLEKGVDWKCFVH